MAIFALAMCAILGILCRSWRVFLMCASATIAAYGMESLLFVNGMNDALLAAAIGPFWHLCMAGTLLWWAIRERLRADGSRCLWCGYDLRGAAHEHCPECGNVPVQLLKIQSA
jgi:hypothetical protein